VLLLHTVKAQRLLNDESEPRRVCGAPDNRKAVFFVQKLGLSQEGRQIKRGAPLP